MPFGGAASFDKALFLVFADRWGQMDAPLFDSGAVDMWAGWFSRRYAGKLRPWIRPSTRQRLSKRRFRPF